MGDFLLRGAGVADIIEHDHRAGNVVARRRDRRHRQADVADAARAG